MGDLKKSETHEMHRSDFLCGAMYGMARLKLFLSAQVVTQKGSRKNNLNGEGNETVVSLDVPLENL